MTHTTTPAPVLQQLEGKAPLKTSMSKASTATNPSDATGTKPGDESKATKPKAQPRSGKRKVTKASQVEALLSRKAGATLEQMCEATGWQAHTCRAFMTGLRRKSREISRETNRQGKSVYLMVKPGNADGRS